MQKKIICNPLNLEYRYQIKTGMDNQAVFREAADPTMLLFKDRYYMFVSMSGGFWHSDDLYAWEFHETPELPIYDYAPDVREINGKVVFSASKRDKPCSLFISSDPLNEPFSSISTLFPFWDPGLFQDDDGRVYLFWGCSNSEPIRGIELDADTLQTIGDEVVIFAENEAEHGWERNGENNVLAEPKTEMEKLIRQHIGTKPFIEGAYMNKSAGMYYLQYAAPGTQYNVYSDGVYVSDKPLGPFVYQEHNPFSSKPGGFITGAGHGSTFKDKHGNWWHVSTMVVSVNENFERRIGLFPCDIDADGVMYCNQHFADYPFYLPEEKRKDMDKTAPEMMLLSSNAKVEASSYEEGHEPEMASNENIRTWWTAETDNASEWIRLDLGSVKEAQVIQLNFADHKRPLPEGWEVGAVEGFFNEKRKILVKPQCTAFLMEGSIDGNNWFVLKDARQTGTDLAHDLICFETPQRLRYIKLSNIKLPLDGKPAISGLRVFGKSTGPAPDAVIEVDTKRTDERLNIHLKWKHVEGADGYNVRYGVAEDKLYSSWQLMGKSNLNFSMVNSASGYYIAVDSFNENGVTAGKVHFVE